MVNAVDTRDLCISYAKGTSKFLALNNLTLQIPSGCIYSLIGPSGCGKTTYLRSLIGLVKVQSGTTLLYGYPLGHRSLAIPGCDLGYMPQEVALDDDLTIGEMVKYFNRLYRMNLSDVTPPTAVTINNNEISPTDDCNKLSVNNYANYLDILTLPPKSTLIKSLSGGQKRRVSFLCSILHDPKLIILDEPTVGCDPLVICSMWTLLRTITSTKQSTVIITTHYLEEARKTDFIGFMRKGQLLEQGSPNDVLTRLQVNSIEDAFTLMCQRYQDNKTQQQPSHQSFQTSQSVQNSTFDQGASSNGVCNPSSSINNSQRTSDNLRNKPPNQYILFYACLRYLQLIYAVTNRLCLRTFKSKLLLLASISIGPFFMGLSIYCIGPTPVTNIGYVNYEDDYPQGSLVFLKKINSNLVNLVPYNSTGAAREDTLNDKLHGYFTISPQFTRKLIRLYTFNEVSLLSINPLLDSSLPAVVYYGDNLQKIATETAKFIIESALNDAVPIILNNSGFNPALGSPVAKIVDLIGKPESPDDTYNIYVFWLPIYVIYYSFVATTMISSSTFYQDRLSALFEHNRSAGLSYGQYISGHFLSSMVLSLFSSWPVLLIVLCVVGAWSKGPILLVWLIYMFNSATAIATAFALASVDVGIFFVLMLVVAYVFSGLFSTGLSWPWEALPYFVKPFASAYPFYNTVKAMRRVLGYGVSWDDSVVRWSLLESSIYVIAILLLVCLKFNFQ